MSSKKRRFFERFNFTLFFITIILSLFGVLVISSATKSIGLDNGNLPFIKTHLIATLIGIGFILILLNMDYDVFGKLYIPLYVISVLLLASVFVFGTGVEDWGARSWIRIGPVGFQPAEVAKLTIIISMAKIIEKNQYKINNLLTLGKILLLSIVPIYLVLKQPDLGTAMVYVFFIAIMLFVAGLDFKYIGYAALSGLLSLPLIWLSLGEYQRERIANFGSPERDTMGTGYQALQSQIAVGSGKLFGKGLYNGSQTQFGYLPEKQTDFIFAVVGEELGFIGGTVLLLLYFIMLYKLIDIARKTKDTFGKLIVVGVFSMLFVHILQNVGMNIGITPITGIPLPFMSYGGTFQLTNMIAIGLVLSIGAKRDSLNF